MICRFIGVGAVLYHNNQEMLGFEMLSASMRRVGFECEIIYYEFDINQTIKEFCDSFQWNQVLLVGFSPFYTTFDVVKKIISYLKKSNPHLLFCAGGAAVSHAAEKCLEYMENLDIVIRGEGEKTICDLYRCISNKQEWYECKGITYRKGHTVYHNPNQELIEDLDELPWADRVMLGRYSASKVRIQTARGCEGNCTFCAESRVFNPDNRAVGWRGRSPRNVVDEFEFISKHHNIHFFSIVDESYEDPISTIGIQRIEEISDEILHRGLNIYFEVLMRSEDVLKIPLQIWKKLKYSGLVSVLLGLESGSGKALRTYGKIANVQQNFAAYSFLYDHLGINVIPGFIMLNPYSTIEELRDNMQFLIKLNLEYSFRVFSNRVQLFYNTPLYHRVLQDGLLRPDYDITNPEAYFFKEEDIEKIAKNMDEVIKIVNKKGRGAYVTDYFHDTYERIVMYEKNGDKVIADELKKEMKDLRKRMGKYMMEIFQFDCDVPIAFKEKYLLDTMKNYEDVTLRTCNSVLRKIIKNK